MALAPRVRRIDSNGNTTFGASAANFCVGSEATAQRIRTGLREVLGEWFADMTAGVPWYQPEDPNSPSNTGNKPLLGADGGADVGYNDAVIKAAILGIVGVASLDSYSSDFDHVTRRYSGTASGTDIDGAVFTATFQDPGP